MPDTFQRRLFEALMDLVGRGSVINTDDYMSYVRLSEDSWDHRVVNPQHKHKYVRDDVHKTLWKACSKNSALAEHLQRSLQEEPRSSVCVLSSVSTTPDNLSRNLVFGAFHDHVSYPHECL